MAPSAAPEICGLGPSREKDVLLQTDGKSRFAEKSEKDQKKVSGHIKEIHDVT